MAAPDTVTGPRKRTVAGRIAGYPLVTSLVGFFLFLFVLQALVFGNLTRLFMVIVGAPLPPPGARGLPTDGSALAAYGYGQLVAALIVVPIAVWVYRQVIVRWCEGRDEVPELALTTAARRWILVGGLLSVGVIALALLAVVIGGGQITSLPHTLVLPGIAGAVGVSLFAGVVEELFARGTLFRISEQHVGSLPALAITAVVFGLQHADNPSATVVSTVAVAVEGGVMLAAVYMLARTLWAVMAVHFVWNLGQSLLGLPVSGNETIGAVKWQLVGPDWLIGGVFGIEVSAVALTAWTVITVVLLVLVVRRGLRQPWGAARTAVAAGKGSEPVGIVDAGNQ
ncbi:MAG: type II CAAX endopeptidase family protein [Candidatus Nanopelagicales bacterium]